jgi:hypothetical protein
MNQMTKNKNKVSNGFLMIIVILIVIAVLTWLFWADIKKIILGSDYNPITVTDIVPKVNQSLKDEILLRLRESELKKGWPIIGVGENPDRGNPFKKKQ